MTDDRRDALREAREALAFVADWAHDCSPSNRSTPWERQHGDEIDPRSYGFDDIEERCRAALAEHNVTLSDDAPLRREQRLHGITIDQRDRAQDYADELAGRLAPVEVLGEHSNLNNPWQNALDHDDERRASTLSDGRETLDVPMYEAATEIVDAILDRPFADPDDDLAKLARAFLRRDWSARLAADPRAAGEPDRG